MTFRSIIKATLELALWMATCLVFSQGDRAGDGANTDTRPAGHGNLIGTPGGAATTTPLPGGRDPGDLEMVIDISEYNSWDDLGASINEKFNAELGIGSIMTGIGWNVTLTTIGNSLLSDAAILFNTVGTAGVFIRPGGGTDMPGTMSFNSGGIIDLTDNGLPDIPADALGQINAEFYEFVDNVPGNIDTIWTSGTITIAFHNLTAPGELRLSQALYSVVENEGEVLIGVERLNGTDGGVSVILSSESIQGGASNETDYIPLTQTVTFADGVGGTQFFAVTILDDQVPEDPEDFRMRLLQASGGAIIVTPGDAIVTITDDDTEGNPGELEIDQHQYNVNEGDGSVTIRVMRVDGSSGTVGASVRLDPGSATANEDYVSETQFVTFADGDSVPKEIMIPIIDDEETEDTESFVVRLASPTGGVLLGFPKQGTVNIFDNDQPVISWRSSLITSLEEAGINLGITAELDIPFGSEVTIPVGITGTATLDSDYTLSDTNLVFTAGSTSAALTLGVIDDDLVELDETITFTLSTGAAEIGAPSIHTLTITNDDSAVVNWLEVPSEITEGGSGKRDTSVTLQAELSNPVDYDVMVPYSVSGSATLNEDHNLEGGTLLFQAGSQTASLSFTLIDDTSPESAETLILELLPNEGVVAGENALVSILIKDNDNLSISWSSTRQSLSEDDGSAKRAQVQVEAVLSNGVSEEVRVPFTVSGSSDVGTDHDLEAGVLVFPPGEISQFINFDVLADELQEYDETVLLTLEEDSVSLGEKRVHQIVILDNDDGQAPSTTILDVGPRLLLAVNQIRRLSGLGSDPQGEALSYEWEVCPSIGDCEVLGLKDIDLTFALTGEYVVRCTAIDANGNRDPTPVRVKVRVVEELPPTVTISHNVSGFEGQDLSIAIGTRVDFEANVPISKQASKADLFEWFFIHKPDETSGGSAFSFQFDEAGEFTLAVRTTSDAGAQSSDAINIKVAQEAPPTVFIRFPADGETAQVGESIMFLADINVPAEKRRSLEIFWVTGDHRENPSGQNPDIDPYTKSGQYQVRVIVRDQENGYQVEDQVTLFIRDPDTRPVVDFAFPTDIIVPPVDLGKRGEGGAVFFNALVRDNKGYENLTYFWDFDGERSNNEAPGTVFFSPGTHTVSLFALGEDGEQSETVTRTIVVAAIGDGELEPNDQPEQAPLILPGRYENLTLDDAAATDYYRVSLTRDGQRLLVDLEVDDQTSLAIYDGAVLADPQVTPLATRQFSSKGNLQVENLPAGEYYLRLKPAFENSKRALSFNLSVSVLNPALYFPDVRMDETVDTFLGVVNTTAAAVSVEAIGYDADGNLVGRVQQELPARGRSHQSIGQLFGALATDVAWLQYDASGAVQGYSITESRDHQEVYATSASIKLSSELYVPHIAQKVEDWFTRAAVVNGRNEAGNSVIQTPGDPEELFLGKAYSKDSFDFLTRFGGAFSEGQVQAVFKDLDENASMAGIEVFGFLNSDDRVVAGLGLADGRKDNPNFTFIANNIYFTHIARNPDFYTGIALVNIGSFEQGVVIRAYGDGGAVVGQKVATLTAGEKLVLTATALLDGIGSPQDVDWILVQADEDVVGFEIFGTNDGTRLAGLEASTGLTTEICYPFFDGNPAVDHGISVINVDPDPEADPDDLTVTFILYDDSGTTIGQPRTVMIKPNQKFIGLVRDIFSEDLANSNQIPGWMCAAANAPMAGFELFIRGNEMGAITSQ